jgi:hypothetical protein
MEEKGDRGPVVGKIQRSGIIRCNVAPTAIYHALRAGIFMTNTGCLCVIDKKGTHLSASNPPFSLHQVSTTTVSKSRLPSNNGPSCPLSKATT